MDENQIKLFSSKKSDNWQTPPEILDKLRQEFGELYDPCPLHPTEDGLLVDWKEITFVNPPYSQVKKWLKKCHEELKKGKCKVIIFLTFVNTDTSWFWNYVIEKAEIRFIKGRLKFLDETGLNKKNSAMRPSMLCIFRGAETV